MQNVAHCRHNGAPDRVGFASKVGHEQADVHEDQPGQPAWGCSEIMVSFGFLSEMFGWPCPSAVIAWTVKA